MNKSLVFRNKKQYDQFVSTPNGSGRRLPVGKCVSGSFYIQMAKLGHLVQVPEHLVKEEDILWNAELSGYNYPVETQKEPEVPAVKTVSLPVQETVSIDTPVNAETVEKVAALSFEEKELFRLGMEELKLIAAAKGIDFDTDVKRKKLVNLILNSKG